MAAGVEHSNATAPAVVRIRKDLVRIERAAPVKRSLCVKVSPAEITWPKEGGIRLRFIQWSPLTPEHTPPVRARRASAAPSFCKEKRAAECRALPLFERN